MFLILFKMFINIHLNIKGNESDEQQKARENRPYCRTLHLSSFFSAPLMLKREKEGLSLGDSLREAPGYCSAEPPSANPCYHSPAIKKMYMMSSDVGGFIRTDLPWEPVVERQMKGLLPSTLLGFAANSNSLFQNSLKLKEVIFLSVTTLLWGVSANVDLTEGVRMCFLLQLLPNTNIFYCVCQDHVCICGCLYPCRHLHG